jgi:uncharacterized RDD family membrane protein YckC
MPTPARPWPRFLARQFDYILFSIAFGLAFPPSFLEIIQTNGKNNDLAVALLLVFCWMPLEAVFLATWGTTPGKAILGIRLANQDGSKLTFGQSIARSFLVWRGGVACGVPLIFLITEILAYRKLRKTGSTSWDSRLQLSVSQEQITMTRQIVFGVLLLGIVAMLIFANFQNR